MGIVQNVAKYIHTPNRYNPEISLERLVSGFKQEKVETEVDRWTNISYSLVVGGLLDSLAGLTPAGLVGSRSFATVVNALTGGKYGKWRNYVYEKMDAGPTSSKARQLGAELVAFNSFQTPVYALAVAVGDVLSTGSVDPEKIMYGALSLSVMSPAIGPTMGWSLNRARELFGLQTPQEKAMKDDNQEYTPQS